MKKILLMTLVAIFASVCLLGTVACSNNDNDNIKIKLNEVTHSVFYAPLYVAINNGYFLEEGLEIELTNGGGSDKTMTAIMSGQADIGLAGPETVVYVKAGGSQNSPVVFGQLTQKDGSFLIGRTPVEDFKWSDVRGKEIIGGRKGGMPAMCLEYALYLNGLGSSDVKVNYDIQFDLIASAFESGVGDYCTMFEPVASTYEKAGKGYVATSVGAMTGNVPYTCFMATKKYVSDNLDTVTKFMKAIIKGINFVTENSGTAVATALVKSFPDTDVATLSKAVDAYKAIDAYKTTPVMNESEYDTLINILRFSGAIDTSVAFADVIDNSVAQALVNG